MAGLLRYGHRSGAASKRGALASLAAAGVLLVAGCGLVVPEYSTATRSAPEGRQLSPPPPADLWYVTFEGARIPERTRDGRTWGGRGNAAPDPYAKLFVADREILRTPTESSTLEPTWPDQRRGNHRIARGAPLRVEVWDANALNDAPICIKKTSLRAVDDEGRLEIRCDSGAHVRLRAEPARARVGLGLYYELRTVNVYVSRVLAESPAARAGLESGDQIREIQGRRVTATDEAEVRSLINAYGRSGLRLVIRDASGKERQVELEEGPIYPLIHEDVPLG